MSKKIQDKRKHIGVINYGEDLEGNRRFMVTIFIQDWPSDMMSWRDLGWIEVDKKTSEPVFKHQYANRPINVEAMQELFAIMRDMQSGKWWV